MQQESLESADRRSGSGGRYPSDPAVWPDLRRRQVEDASRAAPQIDRALPWTQTRPIQHRRALRRKLFGLPLQPGAFLWVLPERLDRIRVPRQAPLSHGPPPPIPSISSGGPAAQARGPDSFRWSRRAQTHPKCPPVETFVLHGVPAETSRRPSSCRRGFTSAEVTRVAPVLEKRRSGQRPTSKCPERSFPEETNRPVT